VFLLSGSRRPHVPHVVHLEHRVAAVTRYVTLLACGWFALAALWGVGGLLGAGHVGSMGGMGAAAENILRWHIWGPVVSYPPSQPSPADYYCHHPWGLFWGLVPLIKIFGHHDWVLWIGAVAMSAATPPLLYSIAKQAWGRAAGMAAACGFAVLPITVSFANFYSLEVMVIFGCTLFFWGHTHYVATRKPRHLIASLLGVVVATSGDWPAFLAIGTFLGLCLARAYLLPASWSAPSGRPFGRWWALSAALSVGMLALWVGLFHHSDRLAEWLGSASMRTGDPNDTLASVLASRKHWIELMFTPLSIALGKLALPVAVARSVVRRRDEEFYSLAMLVAATVQYVVFKQGADVHIFWPHYFGAYYALAFAQLVASAGDVLTWGAAKWKLRAGAAIPVTLCALVLVPTLAMTPDAFRTLRYARESGGRFNERGWPTPSDSDAVLLLHRLRETLPPLARLEADASMQWGWHHMWAWGRPATAGSPPTSRRPPDAHPTYFLARGTWLMPDQQKALAALFHVDIYGGIWVVDLSGPPSPIEAFTFGEREPSWWEWAWRGGTEPVYTIVADPFATWEWRTHFGQPAEVPREEPKTLAQLRIAHNVAVASGDAARTAALRGQIEASLRPQGKGEYADGVSLLGTRRIGGTQPRIETWFRATQKLAGDGTWIVHSRLIAPKPWSLIPPDPLEREVNRPLWPTTSLWKPGFIYAHTAVLWHRIGVEEYVGAWGPHAGGPLPVRSDGTGWVQLDIEP
jgi:hypothetical protein